MYKTGILTLSDKGAQGLRDDISGQCIVDLLPDQFCVLNKHIIADDFEQIKTTLIEWCDTQKLDIIFTTGGTGLSPRDNTPEATLAVASKIVPGIAEAMRNHAMTITKKAMLSRAVCVIRGTTLIVNLPGSPKAVNENLSFIIEPLKHGLDTLLKRASECARPLSC